MEVYYETIIIDLYPVNWLTFHRSVAHLNGKTNFCILPTPEGVGWEAEFEATLFQNLAIRHSHRKSG
jgi:hypothetical protein